MKLAPFAMERLQSIWEHQVAWNLAESGVHPLRVEELLQTEDDRLALLRQDLCYTQTNGTADLRTLIASMYPDATPAHVQVTNGGSEANCIALLAIVQPDDDVVVMMPNYMQVPELARALGARVQRWNLVASQATTEVPARWRPDFSQLETLVTARTRAILICNPDNPTGARFTAEDLNAVCRIASRVGAWVLADEIYRGAELDGVDTPTVWGRYDRAIVTSGLSKAYALPGLRIGWVVGPPALVEETWGIHDYTTIGPGAINDRLARVALSPARRELLLVRTRGILRTNYPVLRRWIEKRSSFMSHVPPEAGAIAFLKYELPINSTALVERVRDEHSVLIVPGDHFDMDGYLRIGFGTDPELLIGALDRLGEAVDAMASGAGALASAPGRPGKPDSSR
ncbi:MAG TPA: aminotransferase class I/II-fold pyridoxal phosphate-dependent enzyme [Thermoanaerobaculia bacterium]|nr:aminotransferase class I/II-fold pyridoxal phosphate-dependent enzyme [Thermoanaerobaculia bacterium]